MTNVDIKMSVTEAMICYSLLEQFVNDDNAHPKDKEFAKRTIKTIDEALEKWCNNEKVIKTIDETLERWCGSKKDETL